MVIWSATLSAIALLNSSCFFTAALKASFAAFLAALAFAAKVPTTATTAAKAAAIQPHTGIARIAAPTALKAPARVKFATVPALAAAAFVALLAVSRFCIAITSFEPLLDACFAVALRASAAVLISFAAVFLIVSAVSVA